MQPLPAEDPSVWEQEIRAFEAEDLHHPPVVEPVVFVGSSSIRMWSTLERDMAPLPVLNRGFGGSQLDEVVYFAERVVLRYRPCAVVLYGGENDLEAHRGKTPQGVIGDVERFADLLGTASPEARLYLLSVKPSPARAEVWPQVRRFNELLHEFARADRRRAWVDIAAATVDDDGVPRTELFLEDGLHLSVRGYELWTSLLRPRLLADAARGWTSAPA